MRRSVPRLFALAGVVLTCGAANAALLRVATYNVHGLPPITGIIPDVTANMTAIAPLLEALHADATPTVVALEEAFYQPYYDILTSSSTVHYAAITSKTTSTRPPSTNAVGDGLVLFSDASLIGPAVHTTWSDCFGSGLSNGGDCEAPKGFLFARVSMGAGMEIDLYSLHADAGSGSDTGSIAARVANLNQLAAAIAANSVGRAVIVLGDTNSLYTRSSDVIASFASGLGLTDAWVQRALGGVVPGAGATNNSGCPAPRGSATGGAINASGATCELVDKIFYRSSTSVLLTLQNYDVPLNFVAGSGSPLSDHLPVTALFDVLLVPEPATLGLLVAGSLTLAARRRWRSPGAAHESWIR
jgi:endonuclease/exonuclease/phosphatase family metal-dependent hydrolase